MVMYWVYVLRSQSTGRFYCGQTSDLEKRVAQHNDPNHTFTRTTKVFDGPWLLVWEMECADRTAAIRLERKIKKRGIERFLSDTMASGGC